MIFLILAALSSKLFYCYLIYLLLTINFRTYEKVHKKKTTNQQNQERLENKLEKEKDLVKWETILEFSFEVKRICQDNNNWEDLNFQIPSIISKLL